MLAFSKPYIHDPGVILEENPRAWTLDGRRAPGITTVLDYVGVRPLVSDTEAMNDGTWVHKGIEWSVDGTLDLEDFATRKPHLVGLLESGRRALEFFQVRPGWVEIWVCHRGLWYCTAIDAVGIFDGEEIILNWKTGERALWHKWQSAGESLAFWGNGHPMKLRASVHLQRDGSFDPKRDVDHHRDAMDFCDWEHFCRVAEIKIENGIVRPEAKAVARKKEEAPVLGASELFAGTEATTGSGLFG